MVNLFQSLEHAAGLGAEGLAAEARESVVAALSALRLPEGGFAGLDGRADPYYSFFAWLGLRALRAPYDGDGLCAYMQAHRRLAQPVDAQCAQILLAGEGRGPRHAWMELVSALLQGDSRGMYGVFLLMLATGDVPRWMARLAWLRQRSLFAADAAERLPTPRLAAGVVLSAIASDSDERLVRALESRRCAGGGFASAEGAPADLLATAVARFALAVVRGGRTEGDAGKERDLAFVEACWLDDGLFGPFPGAVRGDSEHTFYGLLALGTCR